MWYPLEVKRLEHDNFIKQKPPIKGNKSLLLFIKSRNVGNCYKGRETAVCSCK